MRDPPERLCEPARKGDITWRRWCDRDKYAGPITTQWNITVWPTIHVLDSRGIIRFRNVAADQLDSILSRLAQEIADRQKSISVGR